MYMDEVVLQSQSGSGFCTRAVGTKCRRWSPTAQQVKVLTDLFASGLRTPTTEQIQMISSHLGSFGKVESKNVFYWFQNHKARDRHHRKRRRGSSGGGDICVIGLDNKKEARCPQDIRREWEQEVQVWEQREREIATLELFPLSSYGSERVKAVRKGWREISFSDIAGRDPVPLDLRLSFSCK